MLMLEKFETQQVSGGSKSTYSHIDLKIMNTTIEQLPILLQISNSCINDKWSIDKLAAELIQAGINPNQISVDADMEFDNKYFLLEFKG